jgi:hypothetical protein
MKNKKYTNWEGKDSMVSSLTDNMIIYIEYPTEY